MPGRKTPLVTNQIYHVFNQGQDRRITFSDKKEYSRAMITLKYYQLMYPPVKLSYLLCANRDKQKKVLFAHTDPSEKIVSIIAYCLMPNHYLYSNDTLWIVKYLTYVTKIT